MFSGMRASLAAANISCAWRVNWSFMARDPQEVWRGCRACCAIAQGAGSCRAMEFQWGRFRLDEMDYSRLFVRRNIKSVGHREKIA
jgi:hypothetical protein